MKITFARAGVTTLAALGLAFAATTSHAQTTIIAGWDFENVPTSTNFAAPSSIAADQGTAAEQATSNLSPGGTAFANVSPDGKTPGYAYATPGDTTPGTTTASNTTLRLGIGNNTTGPNNGSSLVWNASTVGFNAISVTYDTYASSASAFQTQQLGYSTDGGTTFTLVSPIVAVPLQSTKTVPVAGADAAGYSPETFNLSSIAGLNNNAGAEFELIFSGVPAITSTAAPNDRFDNLSVNGTVLTGTPSAAPEPSQMAGLGFFLLGISGLALRARKKAAANAV